MKVLIKIEVGSTGQAKAFDADMSEMRVDARCEEELAFSRYFLGAHIADVVDETTALLEVDHGDIAMLYDRIEHTQHYEAHGIKFTAKGVEIARVHKATWMGYKIQNAMDVADHFEEYELS
ncbi:MAG: hypothetical protein Unbinned1502contig1001_44 [Prokaryotic dsDNA virus sp.]|nr:MAG: hypothetical protein Unbinned1502contig1001_44 [Prokaryotic dsDNA virus sp.]|tara:strand:- start:259 stop:621 length:363 start_codon:yes stop_codon:yes gene_type:complete